MTSQSQQLDTSRAGVVLKSQEERRRLQPGKAGWLVAIANNNENRENVMQVNRVQDTSDPYSSRTVQEAPSKKPGDRGWLVSFAESLEEDRVVLRQQGNYGGKGG